MPDKALQLERQEEDLQSRYQKRLEQEVARLREESRKAFEEFKRSFAPPDESQIERLLYPELSTFEVTLGGRRFVLRELPAIIEKKFLRLVEQKLPALVGDILSFDERLGDRAAEAFAHLFARASNALDVVTEACVLVLDPTGEDGVTREFVQQHASTARQLCLLQAQLQLNGARDFLSQLFPALRMPRTEEPPARPRAARASATPGSRPPPVGSNSSAIHPAASPENSPSANWP
jgi:hypothetical protein